MHLVGKLRGGVAVGMIALGQLVVGVPDLLPLALAATPRIAYGSKLSRSRVRAERFGSFGTPTA